MKRILANRLPSFPICILLVSSIFSWAATAADTASAKASDEAASFETEAAMHAWATSQQGGARWDKFNYKGKKLICYFRCFTSGEPTSEPVVFIEKKGTWIQVLRGPWLNIEMEATIEEDALLLWRLEWPNGKREKSLYLKFNLATLDLS